MRQRIQETSNLHRSSKRIKKIKNDLHLTLTRDQTKEIQIKEEKDQESQRIKNPLHTSLEYLPMEIRVYLATKGKITLSDIETLTKNLTETPKQSNEEKINNMRLLIGMQDQKLQEMSENNLENIDHSHILEYLKTFHRKPSFNEPMFCENSFLQENEVLGDEAILRDGNCNNDSEEENFVLFRRKIDSNNNLIHCSASGASLKSLNETTSKENSSLNSSDFLAFKENSKMSPIYQPGYNFTPSTTPNTSKKSSPLFSEKKNLLLSSKIEDIINERDEIFCQKFNEEDLSINNSFINGKPFNNDLFLKDIYQENFEEEESEQIQIFNESLLLLENENSGFF